MNYIKVYLNVILGAKSQNRNKTSEEYYEKHHIFPDFMFTNRKRRGPVGHLPGNPDILENIVLLTPREHLLCHILLSKALINTRYEYQAKSSVVWFYTKVLGSHPRQNKSHPGVLRKYERYRIIGLEGISKCRKGKMPVMDRFGNRHGSVEVNHPNVLSGEWVHITKGRKITKEELSKRKPSSGRNNSNYKEMNEDRRDRLFNIMGRCLEENYLIVKLLEKEIKKEFVEFKRISLVWIKNNFSSYEEMITEYNKATGSKVKYDPYYRNSAQRKEASILNSNFCWYTNGIADVRIKTGDSAPIGFVRGRSRAKDKKS